jgi:hypothetical protein
VHNLADASFVNALNLRKKTAAHPMAMTERREYFISRFAPKFAGQHTELNRLTATLNEVMSKVTKYLSFEK